MMNTAQKLAILSAAAKYDASCSSSGSERPAQMGALGNGALGGICHAWAADGRCVSLLKVLFSNVCAYDCAYCVNRRSNDIPRSSFSVEELVRLTVDFYKRNYIEGLFLSSAVLGKPDHTMEQLILVSKTLRERERWNGYLHLKAIPGASPELVTEAARWADRVSVNIELPSAESLTRIAPDKTPASIFSVMRTLAQASGFEVRRIPGPAQPSLPATSVVPAHTSGLPSDSARPPSGSADVPSGSAASVVAEPKPLYDSPATRGGQNFRNVPPFLSVWEARKSRYRNSKNVRIPAGQTTQLVIGASPESDATILGLAQNLYLAYDVRRVYYSAFISHGADPRLPALPGPPLLREHRLYQADWLFRFYGFRAEEIIDPTHPFLEADVDPKTAWALNHLNFFPVEVTTAEYTELLRVPGIGPTSASRILKARRQGTITFTGLKALGVVMKRALYFITCSGKASPELRQWQNRTSNQTLLRSILRDGAMDILRPLQREFDWTEGP